jgi:tripartite-type tricarboxylate transporter receptor subunit TctC
MKKLLITLSFWTGIVHATTTNYVWIPWSGGALDVQCRALWNEYDLKYGTKTIFQIKPGNDGLIATNDMLNTPGQRKFMCGGSGQVISNALVHPTDTSIDRIEALVQTAVNTMVWYVPNNNNSRNLTELMKYFKGLNRPINVGVFFAGQRGIVHHLEKVYGVNVNIITYRSGPQMYPDLTSGDLDLAFDAGGAIDVAKATGKFKILGYLANNDYKKLNGYPNFRHSETELPLYYQWLGIFVPVGADPKLKTEVTQQLQEIVKTELFKMLALENMSTVTGIGQPELNVIVLRQRKLLEKYWR